MIGIWLTVTSAIVSLAIMTGFLREISQIYRGAAGDIVVIPFPRASFQQGGPAKYSEFEATIRKVDGVLAASPHMVRPVLLRVGNLDPTAIESIGEDNFGELIGLDPTADLATTDFAKYVSRETTHGVADPAHPFQIDRTKLRAEDRELPVVLVGAGLRERFDLSIGQRIELLTLPDDASADSESFEPLSQAFVVGGAVRCGHFKIDQRGLYAELEVARAFVRSSVDASEICVKAEASVTTRVLAEQIRSALFRAGLSADVNTWQKRNENELAAISSQRGVLALLLFFFVLVACFNVFATMTILVTDKTRDIGILAAIGASPTGLLTLFASSGFVMAFFASIAGSATGALLAHRINDVHDAIWKVTGTRIFKPDVYLFDRIPIQLDTHVFPLIVLATVAFSVLCASIPALRAARLDPVRALRQE